MIGRQQIRDVQSGSSLPARLKPDWMVEPERTAQTAQSDADEMLYLIGYPTLRRFRRFVRNHAVNPDCEGVITDEWNAASDYVHSLEKEEAGLADDPAITK